MGRKHADAREEQERNNDIHDATCLFGATLDAAMFPAFFVHSRKWFRGNRQGANASKADRPPIAPIRRKQLP
jgi:hypothetical protein